MENATKHKNKTPLLEMDACRAVLFLFIYIFGFSEGIQFLIPCHWHSTLASQIYQFLSFTLSFTHT